MTHDPMCPQYDCWLEGCTVCDECALIARVREDERKTSCAEDLHTDCPCYREGRDVADDDVTFWEPHYQAGYTHGYGVALHDAMEAIEAVDPPSEAYDDWHPKGKRLALAAIDALRGSGNPHTPPSAEKGEQA